MNFRNAMFSANTSLPPGFFARKLGELRRMPTYGTACRDVLELAIVRLALVNNAMVRYILLHE